MTTSPVRQRVLTRVARLIPATHAALYRGTGGQLGGKVGNLPILLLTTTGRKSGQQRTTPLAYLMDGSAYVVTASNAGRAYVPAWWLNLQSNPRAVLQVGRRVLPVTATRATPEEKGRLWATLVSRAPMYDGYQKRATRDIPMVMLRPTVST